MLEKKSYPSNEIKSMIRATIMMVVMIISIGYMFLWVIMPTNLYKQKWQPQIRANTDSVYFGKQGATILMNSFPVLFIAALGCVYLHLIKNISSEDNIKREELKHRLAIWKRPMIIKGLGIVSRIELSFFLMFIALLVWCFANYLHIGFAKITPEFAAKKGEKVWETRLGSVALRLGLVGNICLSFLFFPVTRGSSVLPIFGLTSESSIKYHIWLGHIVMTLFTAHGVCYVVYWLVTHQLPEMLMWAKTDISNLAGEIALLAGLVIWATTFPRIRRKMFALFFYTHHLYILFIVFFVFHVGVSYACIMLPGFYLFMIDRYLRFLQSRKSVRVVSARVLPCETIELNFSKNKALNYTSTSIIFVNIPSLSKLQWHPFTITSSTNLEPEKLSILIKGEGIWSKKLYEVLSSPSSIERLDVSVEGPYGPVSTDFLRHNTLVMISGGSGITPFISIIRELMHMHETEKFQIPNLLVVSAFKNHLDLTMLNVILPISGAPSKFSELNLQIEAYVTRENQPSALEYTNLTTIWFKPNPSDAPISPILGRNSWLWLGTIISSSFVVFLLSIAILNRYYIYPIDHNTNEIYPQASRAAINMLFICIAIMITASAAFLWNQRGNGFDATQIQSMEGKTPTGSPNSCYNTERELESLPDQSLVQCINVHYGGRPDLKRILIERKESSVGVLVCGPKNMRHEVAAICSSNLKDNLYFESISFSW